ncbi:MAG: hypothetical protein HQM08_04640 [Candidatus Riflebacteria bacterium]|nr:hypothetical protein [Candidatus Riflebacteria bacterium]
MLKRDQSIFVVFCMVLALILAANVPIKADDQKMFNLSIKVPPHLAAILSDHNNLSNPIDIQFEVLNSKNLPVLQKNAEKNLTCSFEGLSGNELFQVKISPPLRNGIQLRGFFVHKDSSEVTFVVDERSTVVALLYDSMNKESGGNLPLFAVDSSRNQSQITDLSQKLVKLIKSGDSMQAMEFFPTVDEATKKILEATKPTKKNSNTSATSSSSTKNQEVTQGGKTETSDSTSSNNGIEFTSRSDKEAPAGSNETVNPTTSQPTNTAQQTSNPSSSGQTQSTSGSSGSPTSGEKMTSASSNSNTSNSGTTAPASQEAAGTSATTANAGSTTNAANSTNPLTTVNPENSATTANTANTGTSAPAEPGKSTSATSDSQGDQAKSAENNTGTNKKTTDSDNFDVAKMSGANMVMLPETYTRFNNLNVEVRLYSRNVDKYEGEVLFSTVDGDNVSLKKVPELSDSDKITFLVDKFDLKVLKPFDRISFSLPLPSGSKVELYDKDERKTISLVTAP